MLAPELESLLQRIPLARAAAARARMGELAGDPAESAALVHIAGTLGESLESCPDPDAALNNLERFVQARGARLQLYGLFADHPAALETIVQVVSTSQYLADVLVRNPEYFAVLSDTAALGRHRDVEELGRDLRASCDALGNSRAKFDAVRRYRRREVLRIGTADVRGHFDLARTAAQLSHLADCVVQQCFEIVAGPRTESGLFVLALGKLGGCELNYSSDIDLVFVARSGGQVATGTRIARELTQSLGEFSGEGFLYRVDLRLRPYGSSGALVVSADMLQDYLKRKAHPAERQAMLKARPIAGEIDAGWQFLKQVAPVLFCDAGPARQQVRSLKARIERQLRAQGRGTGHVKLAPGGIRDIEFIVQALQLERGHECPEIRTANTLEALDRLVHMHALSHEDADHLHQAYIFLRLVEHRLQLMDNQQVHQLPTDERALGVLARSMGFPDQDEPERFRQAYDSHVGRVRSIFERILPQEGGQRGARSS